jgi:predicted nucleic acid-binding protein
MTLVVVSDTSPIRALAHLQLLNIIPSLFGCVLIPPAVLKELAHPPLGVIVVAAGDLPFADVRVPAIWAQLDRLSHDLDRGEAEALAVALELKADLILIDEAAGRATAEKLGLKYTDTLGPLIRAKRAGIIPAVRPLLDPLQHGLRFFIHDRVKEAILQLAGE